MLHIPMMTPLQAYRQQRKSSDEIVRLSKDWGHHYPIVSLRTRAVAWVDAELTTLDQLLGRQPAEAITFREALQCLEALAIVPRRSQPLGG